MNTKNNHHTSQDWDTAVSLYNGYRLITGTYTAEQSEITQIRLQIDDMQYPYFINITPGDEPNTIQVWMHRYGSGESVYLFGVHAEHPDQWVRMAVERALCYVADSASE